MSALNFPKSPYSELRDDRPKRIATREKLVAIVEMASKERAKVVDDKGITDVEEYMHRHLPKDVRITVGDGFFKNADGSDFKDIDAYCDFEDGRSIRVTTRYFATLIEADPEAGLWKDVRETMSHEFGHIKNTGHKRTLTMRAKNSVHLARAARSRDLYDDEAEFTLEARHLDLEEEADIFAYAFLVPVTELNGKMTISEIAEKFDVSPRVAYQSALLAKDYVRNKFLLERR